MELLGNQMAAANLIREALMALLKAKKSNVSAQGTKNQIRKQGFDDFDDSSPRNPDAIELADDAAENLQRTRQQAQEAQGTDRLANPIDMEDFGNTQLNRDPRNPANTWHDGDRAPVEFYRRTENINSPNLSSNIVDVSNYKDVEVCINDITKKSNIDILINNAGITGPTAALWEYDVEMWKKVVEINLMGTFNCCRTIVPNMIKNNYGRIVNVASVAGKDGNANASAYSVGKAGAIALTKSLGKELADKNIAVNAITPAGANTRILDQMTKEHVQRMLSKVPRGRFLEVEEFTSLVCWLSSEENTFSTAAVFDISGGRSTY